MLEPLREFVCSVSAKQVAVKRIKPEILADVAQLQLFLKEINTQQYLKHRWGTCQTADNILPCSSDDSYKTDWSSRNQKAACGVRGRR
jgi:hypothetical protein